MDIQAEVAALEKRITSAGYTVTDLVKTAQITYETWRTWRNGEHLPNMRSWLAIQRVAEDMIAAPNLDIPPRPSDRPDEAA